MTVYFDKTNYVNYLKSYNSSDKGFDTLRMVKKQLNVHLNFKLEDLDEYEYILHEEFQSGVSPEFKITYNIDLVKRPLQKDSFPSNNGIFLLDDENVKKIKTLHSIIIGSVNEEVETLLKLIITEDYSFHLEKIIGSDITPTNHLNFLNLPFSTLLIVDRYIFKGPEIGGNLGLYEYNLEKILEKVFENKSGDSRLIFVYQVNVKVDIGNPKYDIGPDKDKLTDKIKKVVQKYCPKPEVFLIGVPFGTIDDEHDRYIFSNYLRIKSGDSLVYFDSLGNIKTKSKSVDLYSLGKRDYRITNEQILNKMNTIIKETLDNFPQYSKIPSGKLSNSVLNFN
jgi:hypothetical protein